MTVPAVELPPVSRAIERTAQARSDSQTKPPGSLGRLQHLAVRLAAIQNTTTPNADRACIIAGSAFLAAWRMSSKLKDFCFFAHCSMEQGHRRGVKEVGVEPLLNLQMRPGEGTGTASAAPVLRSATALLRDMATFDVCVAWLRLLFARRIGGYTGDCLGCVQQVTELLVYFSLLAVLFQAGGG